MSQGEEILSTLVRLPDRMFLIKSCRVSLRLRAELAELQRSSRQSDVELREQQRSLTKSEAAAEAEKKRTKDLYDELRVHQEKSARAETERQNLLAELHNERRNSQAAREAERSKAERAEDLTLCGVVNFCVRGEMCAEKRVVSESEEHAGIY